MKDPQEYLENSPPDFLMILHELSEYADKVKLSPGELVQVVTGYFELDTAELSALRAELAATREALDAAGELIVRTSSHPDNANNGICPHCQLRTNGLLGRHSETCIFRQTWDKYTAALIRLEATRGEAG